MNLKKAIIINSIDTISTSLINSKLVLCKLPVIQQIQKEIWLLPAAVDCFLFLVGIGSSSSLSSQVISAGWIEEKYQQLSKKH